MENAIVVNGLRKNYKDLAVIKGISFTVPKGRVFGLLGANGAVPRKSLSRTDYCRGNM